MRNPSLIVLVEVDLCRVETEGELSHAVGSVIRPLIEMTVELVGIVFLNLDSEMVPCGLDLELVTEVLVRLLDLVDLLALELRARMGQMVDLDLVVCFLFLLR